MRCQQKDNKPPGPDGNPKTRGIMDAKTTTNQISSDMLSDILTSLNQAEPNNELLSSEDFLNCIESLNSMIREWKIDAKKFTIGSMDVENLHGSIDTKLGRKLVRDKILKSPIKFLNIDCRWDQIY